MKKLLSVYAILQAGHCGLQYERDVLQRLAQVQKILFANKIQLLIRWRIKGTSVEKAERVIIVAEVKIVQDAVSRSSSLDWIRAALPFQQPGEDTQELSQLDKNLTDTIQQAVSREHGLRVDDVVLIRPKAIPKTTSGKIRRHECKARYLSGSIMGRLVE